MALSAEDAVEFIYDQGNEISFLDILETEVNDLKEAEQVTPPDAGINRKEQQRNDQGFSKMNMLMLASRLRISVDEPAAPTWERELAKLLAEAIAATSDKPDRFWFYRRAVQLFTNMTSDAQRWAYYHADVPAWLPDPADVEDENGRRGASASAVKEHLQSRVDAIFAELRQEHDSHRMAAGTRTFAEYLRIYEHKMLPDLARIMMKQGRPD
jgi:hypothetical protein